MSHDPYASYYDVGGVETLSVLKAKLTREQYIGYLRGSAIKYLLRLGHKSNEVAADSRKAAYFTSWLAEELESSSVVSQVAVLRAASLSEESIG